MSTITGTAANDVLAGTPDSDTFQGLTGSDTALVAADSGDAVFTLDAQGRWVVASPQGDDTLDSIEAVQFADGLVTLGLEQFTVNTSTALDQTQPVLTALAGGGFLATWVAGTSVLAQRFDDAGVPTGDEIAAPALGPRPPVGQYHDTAALPDGGYLVVATTGVIASGGTSVVPQIVVMRFASDGSFAGAGGIAQGSRSYYTGSDVYQPHITPLDDGNFLVSWTLATYGRWSSGTVHVGQRVAGNGTPLALPVTLPGFGDFAAVPGGGYALASVSGSGLAVHRFDAADASLGAPVAVAGGVAGEPAITALANGSYLVVWKVQGAQGLDIHAQLFDGTWAAVGAPVQVNTEPLFDPARPDVTALPDGGWLVAWTSQEQSGGDTDIHARRFDATGAPLGGETVVNATDAGLQQQPTVTALDDGGFAVAWMSSGPGLDGWDIQAQRFDASGAPVPSVHALQGDGAANTIVFAGSEPVHVLGDGGDDVLQGGSGDDRLDGGAGWDLVASPDPHGDLAWQLTGGVLRVAGPQAGSDALQSVEQVQAVGASVGVEFERDTQVRLGGTDSDVLLTSPARAVLGDGSSVVAWERHSSDASDAGVYVQRFDPSGTPTGAALRIEGGQPAVAVLHDGGYVLAWSVGADVQLQRFDADGTPAGASVRVNESGTAYGAAPVVAVLADGGFVVSWTRDVYPDDDGIFARRFDAAGSPASGQMLVNSTPGPYPGEQSVAALADGGYVITWTMGDPATWPGDPGYDIYAQRFASDGTPAGGQARVNASTSDHQLRSEVIALADGGYLVTWMNYSDPNIKAQRFDATGAAVGDEILVNPTAPHSDSKGPVAVALADGGYVIAWAAADGSGSGVTVQRFDAADARVGTESRVNTNLAGEQTQPVLTALADGGYMVTWLSSHGTSYGIDTQRFDADNLREGHLTLTGGAEDNVLRVTAAAEGVELLGGAGSDLLAAAGGWDVLTGGSGADTFEFAAAGNGVDTITDWAVGDRIAVAGASFSGAVASGSGAALAANAVESSSSGGTTTLSIGTDATPGADVTIRLHGSFAPGDFSLHDDVIEWAAAPPGDGTAPVAIDFFPAPGSAMLPPDWQPGITFSEPVQPGAGTITLQTAGGQLVQTFSATDPRVQFFGASVVIDPAGDLQPGSTYRLIVAPGAIEDLAGNPYAGESDFTFTTAGDAPAPGDTTAPTPQYFFPAAGSRMLPPDWILGIIFDESVKAGTGTIALQTAAGEPVQTFSVGSDPGIHVSGAVVLIDPAADLLPGTTYRLIVGADAIEDLAGNAYAGTSDHTFTTAGEAPPPADTTAPVAIDFFPAAGSHMLPPDWSPGITFSEAVTAGAGTITLQTAGGQVVQTFSAGDAGLQFFGASVVIDPAADLQPGTTYRLIVAAGAIEDLAGNAYAGESDYAFTTAGSAGEPVALVGGAAAIAMAPEAM